jgi:hypothetical protein
MGTGPDHLHRSIFKQTTASAMEMPTAGEPFLLVRFLCGPTKKMNPVVGPGPDGFD